MNNRSIYVRQDGIVDNALLGKIRILQIGVGRGISYSEWMVSVGIAAITLIDPQAVDADNVGLSGYRASDIGAPKVEAAARHLRDINPELLITAIAARAQNIADLDALVRSASIVKIGIDDPTAQFALADRVQALGVDALVGGTTGDNRQYFVAAVVPEGPPLRKLLPAAYKGVQEGYQPPQFFPSCRVFAERVNLVAADLTLGLLHHRAGSPLPIAQIGKNLIECPLVIGLNGVHGREYAPARFIERPAA